MCTAPLKIKNPYFGCQPNRGYNYLHDCTNTHIEVPCNHCPECYNMRQQRITQRWHVESLENDLFYFTLTYAPRCLVKTSTPAGDFYAPDISDVQKMFKRLRKHNAFGVPFRYYVVSEYGGKLHRPHYHGVISVPAIRTANPHNDLIANELRGNAWHDIVLKEWRRNIGSTRTPKWVPCSDYVVTPDGRRTFDFHYLNPRMTPDSDGDVAFYVSKYVLKYDSYIDSLMKMLRYKCSSDEEYFHYKRYFMPRSYVSKDFGKPLTDKQIAHIRSGIQYALNSGSPYPFFINPLSGATFPLSPYYRSKCFNINDAQEFFLRSTSKSLDSHIDTEKHVVTLNNERFTDLVNLERFKRTNKVLEDELINSDLNYLDIYD